MNGKLRKDITLLFKGRFENDCISLLLDSYKSLRDSGRIMVENNENDITAQLVGFMKNNPRRNDLQISINRENYLDTQETYDGTASADESLRIDVKYSVWNSSIEHEYYMEAKNVGQQNWKKESTGALVDAGKLRRRYIKTGIENFIMGKYPNGCLIAYVLQGSSANIVELINDLLKVEKKEKELLSRTNDYECDCHYISRHDNSAIPLLKHFFLNFS